MVSWSRMDEPVERSVRGTVHEFSTARARSLAAPHLAATRSSGWTTPCRQSRRCRRPAQGSSATKTHCAGRDVAHRRVASVAIKDVQRVIVLGQQAEGVVASVGTEKEGQILSACSEADQAKKNSRPARGRDGRQRRLCSRRPAVRRRTLSALETPTHGPKCC